MATMTEINFAELIDLSLGTPEVVNYKGLRVLLAAIVSKLGVSSVNLELNEGEKKDLSDVRDAQSKPGPGAGTRPATETRPATGTGRAETNVTDIVDKSKSIADADRPRSNTYRNESVPKVIQEMEQKMSQIEGQLSALNALPSNQSLMSRSGSFAIDDGTKKTPVSDMWQLMQCQKKAAANEEGVSKLMSMVEDIMRELGNINQQLQDHTNNLSNLQDKHTNLAKDIEKINEYNKTVETRLSSLEASSGHQDKIDDLNKRIDELQNQLAILPHVDEIVTWPGFEAALKGAYKEPIDHLDSAMQTVTSDHSRIALETMPMNHASTQTSTPIPPTPSPPPSRPVSRKSMRSAVSGASSHPTQEIQNVLRELGEITGKHNILEDRIKTLEDLMSKKADMSEVEALLSQWNVPGDLAKKLAELEEGLSHLRDSKAKLDALEKRLQSQSEHCAVTFEDLAALRQELEQAIADLAEAQDALARDVSQIGTVEPTSQGDNSRLLDELESRLETSLQGLSGSVKAQISDIGGRISSLEKSLKEKFGDMMNSQPTKSIPKVKETLIMTSSADSESLDKLQDVLTELQAEVEKLNTSYIHLVDEHNVKQKHIDALYTFVDRLQENKANKEHVIMEIDVKADKRALDNKVSRSHFDGAVDELSKNLNDVMQKLTGHKIAWDSAVGELKLDIDNKLDRMELDPLKSYLDNRIKSVSSKYVKKEVETGEDAAGFRKPLQKFHCISCDRPLDMAPQAPIASLPENKGLPSNRTGRPYTTFELEQIRAAQKNKRPGRNVQHYERALFRQELARQRRHDIMAYLVHFERSTGISHRHTQDCMPPIRNLQNLPSYDYKIVDSGNFQDVPDYFVASRSCGGSHTMTFPHRRITRVAQTTNMVTTTEDISPVINGRIEADIQGQDGHIYKARLDTGHMTERLPTLTQPKLTMRVKSPRVSSARGRRSHPPSRQAAEPLDNTPLQPTGISVPNTTSGRVPNRPTSARPGSGNKPPSTSSGGRGSPVTAPANTEVEMGGVGVPPPPTPRDTQQETITVPQPPVEVTADQS